MTRCVVSYWVELTSEQRQDIWYHYYGDNWLGDPDNCPEADDTLCATYLKYHGTAALEE